MSQKQELVKLAYKKYEPSSGANSKLSPVIFLHGCTASKEMFLDLPQITAEKTRRTVYAVDARNHGDSAWSDFFNFDINVDDLLYTMDSLSISKAVLVGQSMGGITALRTALKAPERVERFLVEDMYAKKFDEDILNMLLIYLNQFKEGIEQIPPEMPEDQVMQEMIKFVASKLPASNNFLKTDNTHRLVLPIKRDSDGKYIFKANIDVITKALKNGDTLMTDLEGLYDGPAYFFYGTASPFKVYEDEANIKRLFPNAELIAFEGAEHALYFQFPEQFTDMLLKHIPH